MASMSRGLTIPCWPMYRIIFWRGFAIAHVSICHYLIISNDVLQHAVGLTSNTVPQTEICHRVSCRVRKLDSRTLGNLATQPLAKLGSVIGIDLSVEACARDGNVGEAGVEQVWVDAGVAVNEDAFGGKALGAVTGNGVAVVEMTMLVGVEFDLAVVVEADG